ncbi:acyl transferase/acyl hydrolase/lysophospholipase [Aspergillus coremiiformis]|uniref:Patatin-like phospholipase domain-containing protein n=1 Tax=Aspergillus coremiiformis TaxID=138285 RepID=A0A5N6Z4L6_9EURO|nr:acyl transferase/acyl hydrolase/lysophospholipase [Aspergillus coremiiformis]
MAILHDPPILRPHCLTKSKHVRKPSSIKEASGTQRRFLPRSGSLLSLSSVIKSSLAWAGDTWYNVNQDGSSKVEKGGQTFVEDRKQVLYLKMRNAVTYREWKDCAYQLDELEDNNSWKETFESSEYDPHLVHERLKQLEDARISCDVGRMMYLIRTSLSRDLGNMRNDSLYRHSHVGTKNLIDQYITTALGTISSLVELSVKGRCDGLELKYILDQLLAARQAFGRSALLFSGGATFGMNHIGVLKALWQAKLLPRIISGASAGSIVCAVFCTRTDDELPLLLDTFAYGDFAVFGDPGHEENILQKAARFLKYGSFLDISNLAKVMRNWLGDITFQEAYNRTRRILNICVSSAGVYELPRLLNYITAPNVLIWSAVAVSCSVPLVFSPFVLMAKDPVTGEAVPWNDLHRQYIDGSVDGDLPMNRLSEMFNVNHFIVSQVNPHVVPFLPKHDGPTHGTVPASSLTSRLFHTMTHLAKDEVLHRMTVLSELGIFPISLNKTVSIVNQKYSGDINIYPEILYTHFPVILQNPTTEFMLKACISGERATWPKLRRIRNHCAIELALDSAIQQMRARVAFSSSQVALTTNGLPGLLDTIDRGRGRPLNRRSSYSNELEKAKCIMANSGHRSRPLLRRCCSAQSPELSSDTDRPDEADDYRVGAHGTYLPDLGDDLSLTDSGTDNETRTSALQRPGLVNRQTAYHQPPRWLAPHDAPPSLRSLPATSIHSRRSSVGAHCLPSVHLTDTSSTLSRQLSTKSIPPPQSCTLRMTPTSHPELSPPI